MGKNNEHVVVGTHTVKTVAYAQQSNMSMDRMWCIIKRIVEEVEEAKVEGQAEEDQAQGEFILLKDFNKMEFRLYKKDDAEDEEEAEEEK